MADAAETIRRVRRVADDIENGALGDWLRQQSVGPAEAQAFSAYIADRLRQHVDASVLRYVPPAGRA